MVKVTMNGCKLKSQWRARRRRRRHPKPEGKTFRVESEETQDYVREAKDTGQEEAEGLSFVPSAISAPRKPMFRSDSQKSEKTLSFWQLASVVIQEGEEPYTTNS